MSRKFGMRYSDIEDKTIINMLDEGKSSLDIAKFLDRPIGGIEKRITELTQHKVTNRASGNVRFDEIDKIIDLYLSGKGIEYISEQTKRSDRSVKRITYVVDCVKNRLK